MRLCYWVTFALLCLAPVYYGRQYPKFYENATSFEEPDRSGFAETEKPEVRLPAIWNPPLYESEIFGQPGLAIYQGRRRNLFGFLSDGWEWLKKNFAPALSATRMVMDTLSTVIGVVRVIGLVLLPTPFGPGILAATAAFSVAHGVVTIMDMAVNDGQPHPDLGEFGRVMGEINKWCSVVDFGILLFDVGTLATKVIKNWRHIATGVKYALKGVKKLSQRGKTLAKSKGRQGMRSVLGKAEKFFKNPMRSTRSVVSKLQSLAGKGRDYSQNVWRVTKKMVKDVKSPGGLSLTLDRVSRNWAKFKSKIPLKRGVNKLKPIVQDINRSPHFRKGLRDSKVIWDNLSVSQAKGVLQLMDWLGIGNTTEARRFLAVYGAITSIHSGPSDMKGHADKAKWLYREDRKAKELLKDMREAHRIAYKYDSVKSLRGNLFGISTRFGRQTKNEDQEYWGNYGNVLPGLMNQTDSIEELRDFLDKHIKLIELFQNYGNTMFFAHPILIAEELAESIDNTETLQNTLKSVDKVFQSFEKDSYKIREMVQALQNVAEEFEDEVLPEKVTIANVVDIVLATTREGLSSDDAEAIVNFSEDEFKEMEDFSKTIESVEHGVTPIGTLLAGESTFEDTKQLMKAFLKISYIAQGSQDFQNIMEALKSQLSSGAFPSTVTQRIDGVKFLMQHPKGQELQEILKTMLDLTESLEDLKWIITVFSNTQDLQKNNLKFTDLQNIFRILGTSKGLKSSGEMVEVLNQLGIFTRSPGPLSWLQKLSNHVQSFKNQDLARFNKFVNLMDHLPDHENFTTTNYSRSLLSAARIHDQIDLNIVLPKLFNISHATLNVKNITKILGVIGSIEESDLEQITNHFKRSLNSTKSLDELQSIYGVLVDKLVNGTHDAKENLEWVVEELEVSHDHQKTLQLVSGLQELVKNLNYHQEVYRVVELMEIIRPVRNLKLNLLCEHLQLFMSPARDYDDLEDLTKTFENFTVTPRSVELFELLSKGSKNMTDFIKNIRALKVLTLYPKQDTMRFLKFMDEAVNLAESESTDHLHRILKFLGTAPDDVKSLQGTVELIESVAEVMDECGDDTCVKETASFLDESIGSEESAGSGKSIRKMMTSFRNMIENALDDRTVEVMFESMGGMVDASNGSVEVLEKNAEFVKEWVKNEPPGSDIKQTSEAMTFAMSALDAKSKQTADSRNTKNFAPGTDDGFETILKPLMEKLGGVPFEIQTAAEFKKIEAMVAKLKNPARDLQDIQDCANAFERLGPGEKVKEFFQVAETFNFSDASVGDVSNSVVSIGHPDSVKEVPQLVRDVKSCPDSRSQISDMATLIPSLSGLDGGFDGLIGPLKTLGVNETRDFLNGSRAEVMEMLRARPELTGHFKELVETLYQLTDTESLSIIAKGSFSRNSSITSRISTFLQNITTTGPILGLSVLSKSSKAFQNGTGTLEHIDRVVVSMGNVSEAAKTVKDIPVVMKMRGCSGVGLNNSRELQNTLKSLEGSEKVMEEHKNNFLALNALEHISVMYRHLENGPEALENIAKHLEPISQLQGGLKQYQEILKEVELDSEDLQLLAPDLDAIHQVTSENVTLEDVMGQLEMVSEELQVLTELQNEMPEILEKVGILVGVTTKRPSTITPVSSIKASKPTDLPPSAQALVVLMTCARRSQGSPEDMMTCPGYCSILSGSQEDSTKTINIILAILAGTALLVALGLATLRKLRPPADPSDKEDVELAFTKTDSFSEPESPVSKTTTPTSRTPPAPSKVPSKIKEPKKNSIRNLSKDLKRKEHKQKGTGKVSKSVTDSTESRPDSLPTTPTSRTPTSKTPTPRTPNGKSPI